MNEIVILTGFALLFGTIIALLEHYITSKIKPEIDYLPYLPGYNCGACGFGSCEGLAQELQIHPKNYSKCRPLKPDAKKKLEKFIKQEQNKK